MADNLPIGVILSFGGSAAPAGYLLCYGQAISRSGYASLFTVLGTTFGTGDGSTTFNVPDLRGRLVAQPTLILNYVIKAEDADYYVAENGTDFYVTEDGADNYITE